MRKNKANSVLIELLPQKECPADFTRKVILASGIQIDNATLRATRERRYSIYYGVACLITSILLLWATSQCLSPSPAERQARMASNTQTLVQHLVDGTNITSIDYGN